MDGEVEADPDASHSSMTCFFHLSYRHFFIIYIYIYISTYIFKFPFGHLIEVISRVVTIPCSRQNPKQHPWVRGQVYQSHLLGWSPGSTTF